MSDGYRMALAFEQTKIFGLFGMPGGSKPKEYGDLEITYLDLDLMVCRGANSTVYVFVQTNSNYQSEIPPPATSTASWARDCREEASPRSNFPLFTAMTARRSACQTLLSGRRLPL